MAGWKKLQDMRILGKPYARLDGPVKVSGAAKYTHDVQLTGMLYGRILRSPHPHAMVLSVDDSKVKALSGVKAVLSRIKDEVLFVGDDVAAVAAVTQEKANDALALFTVDYDPLPFTVVEEDALQPGGPKVFSDKGNNLGRKRDSGEGDISRGFAEAEVIIERSYRTPVQIHTCLETHGCVAKWEGDELYLWDSTQWVHGIRKGVAEELEIPENKVHVICEHMGGGFGSKLSTRSYHVIAAKLAKQANAPVKLLLDREEDFLGTGNRPSSIQKLKIGAKRDGTLTAFESNSYGAMGVAGSENLPHPYVFRVPNYNVVFQNVHINAGPRAPMRAPGHPQASFAMNSVMDELAEALEMDPLELMMKNDPSETRAKEYAIGAERFGWQGRQKNGSGHGPRWRGMGVGVGRWGGGGQDTQALVSIFPDGAVEVRIGTQDLGTGTRTIIAGVVAEELGLDIEDVTPLIGKSDYPYAPYSGGSTTAPSVCPTVKRAAEKAKAKLIEKVADFFEVNRDRVTFENKVFSVASDPSKKLSWQKACRLLRRIPILEQDTWAEGLSDRGTAGCQFAEVEVDTETGEVKVLKMVAVQDCGLVVNRLTAENQIKGAMIQAIGFALFEQRVLDQDSGIMLNANLDDYKIPGSFEMPELDVTIVDESHRGVIGLGEPPVIPGAGAIANAIANAIGVRIRELPITPDKVLMALAERKEG